MSHKQNVKSASKAIAFGATLVVLFAAITPTLAQFGGFGGGFPEEMGRRGMRKSDFGMQGPMRGDFGPGMDMGMGGGGMGGMRGGPMDMMGGGMGGMRGRPDMGMGMGGMRGGPDMAPPPMPPMMGGGFGGGPMGGSNPFKMLKRGLSAQSLRSKVGEFEMACENVDIECPDVSFIEDSADEHEAALEAIDEETRQVMEEAQFEEDEDALRELQRQAKELKTKRKAAQKAYKAAAKSWVNQFRSALDAATQAFQAQMKAQQEEEKLERQRDRDERMEQEREMRDEINRNAHPAPFDGGYGSQGFGSQGFGSSAFPQFPETPRSTGGFMEGTAPATPAPIQ